MEKKWADFGVQMEFLRATVGLLTNREEEEEMSSGRSRKKEGEGREEKRVGVGGVREPVVQLWDDRPTVGRLGGPRPPTAHPQTTACGATWPSH
jgi:hypothetical protein